MKKKMQRGKMTVELLVSFVSEHKELYDKRHSDYKHLDEREMLWRGIADQIGLDAPDLTCLSQRLEVGSGSAHNQNMPFFKMERHECYEVLDV
ncbi:hypothetical protein PO909_025045 [Leuciscus waleckii]